MSLASVASNRPVNRKSSSSCLRLCQGDGVQPVDPRFADLVRPQADGGLVEPDLVRGFSL